MHTTAPNSPIRRGNAVAEFFTHFLGVPTELEASGLDATAGISIGDRYGGYGILTTGGTDPGDNDGVILSTVGEVLKFEEQRRFNVKSKLGWTPTAGDADNVMAVGVMNAPTENTFLGDNAAGPPANYWGASIFKVDGGDTWQCEVSAGATQYTLDTEIEVTGADTEFEIEYLPVGDGRFGQVAFKIGGKYVRYPNVQSKDIFKPEFTLTSATEMKALVGLKKGEAGAAAVTISIDYFGFDMSVA